MYLFTIFLLIIPATYCEEEDNSTTLSPDEFKCSLPDVTSADDNLDLSRFRSDFSKISEVKFPGLIGPLNERLICKIKCIDGNWVGPLCSNTPDGRFQPILRECMLRNNHPLLAISFKNSSIEKDTSFPHGSVISARCRHFGLYKMKGDCSLRCENGEWAPKLPECVPTTVITNFTGDAPPTILYTVVTGSAGVEPTGELLVFPDSALRLDCVSPRARGDPDWSWTQALAHHTAAWSAEEGERDTHYRLSLSKMSARHSGQYTCTAPTGHTNTVAIRVVSVTCPPLNLSSPHVRQHAQGSRLGHSAHYSCQPGYHLTGAPSLTCMGDGRWSAPAPRCEQTLCPPLGALPAHLSVLEYNASWGGRAVFQCSWGYRLVGAPGLECQHDGAWSGAAPYCTPIYCPEPVVPARARLVRRGAAPPAPPAPRRHPVGDLIVYACDEGLQVVGETSIVCTETGFWSHPPPFCVRAAAAPPADTIRVDNATLVHERADE